MLALRNVNRVLPTTGVYGTGLVGGLTMSRSGLYGTGLNYGTGLTYGTGVNYTGLPTSNAYSNYVLRRSGVHVWLKQLFLLNEIIKKFRN